MANSSLESVQTLMKNDVLLFISLSCINDELATINRKLIKSMKCQELVIVIHLDFN